MRFRRYLAAAHLVDTVVKIVADYYGMDATIVRGKSKRQSAVRARYIAMFTIRQIFSVTYHDIDRLFDYASGAALYATERIQILLIRDGMLRHDMLNIAKLIAARTGAELATPQQKPQRLLAIVPEVAKESAEGTGSAGVAVEAAVDGAETPMEVVAWRK